MKKYLLAAAALLSLVAASPAFAQDTPVSPMAASLTGNDSQSAGRVTVSPAPGGTMVRVELENMTPGWHGVHIHAAGNCDDHHDFKDAGEHAAKPGQAHGFLASGGPHLGDLPNVWVGDDGFGKADFFMTTLRAEDLTDKDGSAFIVHKNPDDYKSPPSGNSGDRVACGVLAQ